MPRRNLPWRRKWRARALVPLAVTAGSVMAAQPAGAEQVGGQGEESLTFTTHGGSQVTCRLAWTLDNPESSDGDFYAFATARLADSDPAACSVANSMSVSIRYLTPGGEEQEAAAFGSNRRTETVSADPVGTVKSASYLVHFDNCDSAVSRACSISVQYIASK